MMIFKITRTRMCKSRSAKRCYGFL